MDNEIKILVSYLGTEKDDLHPYYLLQSIHFHQTLIKIEVQKIFSSLYSYFFLLHHKPKKD